jgi:hypothetical protein
MIGLVGETRRRRRTMRRTNLWRGPSSCRTLRQRDPRRGWHQPQNLMQSVGETGAGWRRVSVTYRQSSALLLCPQFSLTPATPACLYCLICFRKVVNRWCAGSATGSPLDSLNVTMLRYKCPSLDIILLRQRSVLTTLDVGNARRSIHGWAYCPPLEQSKKHDSIHPTMLFQEYTLHSIKHQKPLGGHLHSFSLPPRFRSIKSCSLCIHNVHEFGLQRSATNQEAVNVRLDACIAI